MVSNGSVQAELVLGPGHGATGVEVPLRPDGRPPRIYEWQADGQRAVYLRRHRAVGRAWVYVHEPDARTLAT